jgi:hypothetical protein
MRPTLALHRHLVLLTYGHFRPALGREECRKLPAVQYVRRAPGRCHVEHVAFGQGAREKTAARRFKVGCDGGRCRVELKSRDAAEPHVLELDGQARLRNSRIVGEGRGADHHRYDPRDVVVPEVSRRYWRRARGENVFAHRVLAAKVLQQLLDTSGKRAVKDGADDLRARERGGRGQAVLSHNDLAGARHCKRAHGFGDGGLVNPDGRGARRLGSPRLQVRGRERRYRKEEEHSPYERFHLGIKTERGAFLNPFFLNLELLVGQNGVRFGIDHVHLSPRCRRRSPLAHLSQAANAREGA